MTFRFFKIASLFAFLFSITSISLQAKRENLKVNIVRGGYDFYTSYQVHIPSSLGISPSNFVVNVISGPTIVIPKHPQGKVRAGVFRTKLSFFVDHIPARLESQVVQNKIKNISSVNVRTSSEWYPGIQKVQEKVIAKFFNPPKKKQPQNSSAFRVKGLSGYKLNSIYSLHVQSPLPAHSKLSTRVLVTVSAIEEKIIGFGDKKMLILTASFCPKKGATLDSPLSVLKFVKTKEGLKQISQKSVSNSSFWYPWIKKVCDESAAKFSELKKIQRSMIKKEVRPKERER